MADIVATLSLMMRGPVQRLAQVALIVVTLCGGCGSERSHQTGFGELTVRDLDSYPQPLQSPARSMSGHVIARQNGCVTVVIDGVERVPFWPDGTTVVQDATDFATYHVTLPDNRILTAHRDSGDGFTAQGEVGVTDPAFTPVVGSKADGFLTFCGVDHPPVAFFDADTFEFTPT